MPASSSSRRTKPLMRDAAQPLYMQIADHLAGEIRAGRLKPFAKLPSEYKLVEMFAVSRVTVRLALGRLIEQGLVVTRQGKGAFVAGPVVNHELSVLRGFYDTLVAQGHNPTTTVLSFDCADGPDLPKLPELSLPDEHIYRYQRLYELEGQPIALADAYLPSAGRTVTREDVEKFPIYAIVENLLQRPVASARVRMRASRAAGAIASALSLEEGTPLMVMHRTSLDARGLIAEVTEFHICPDAFEFVLDVGGPLHISSAIRRVPG